MSHGSKSNALGIRDMQARPIGFFQMEHNCPFERKSISRDYWPTLSPFEPPSQGSVLFQTFEWIAGQRGLLKRILGCLGCGSLVKGVRRSHRVRWVGREPGRVRRRSHRVRWVGPGSLVKGIRRRSHRIERVGCGSLVKGFAGGVTESNGLDPADWSKGFAGGVTESNGLDPADWSKELGLGD